MSPLYKNGISKIVNFLDTTSDDKELLKNGLKFMINQEENNDVNQETRIKTSMLRSDLCDYSDAYIIVKGTITVLRPNAAKKTQVLHLKIMHHLSTAFQKLMD